MIEKIEPFYAEVHGAEAATIASLSLIANELAEKLNEVIEAVNQLYRALDAEAALHIDYDKLGSLTGAFESRSHD